MVSVNVSLCQVELVNGVVSTVVFETVVACTVELDDVTNVVCVKLKSGVVFRTTRLFSVCALAEKPARRQQASIAQMVSMALSPT